MHIVVGTTNQLKVAAVQNSFPDSKVHGLDTFQSGVSEEPEGMVETTNGALYRATHSKKMFPDANLWLGIESGFYQNELEEWIVVVAIVIMSPTGTETITSEPLLTPITLQQRYTNIYNALQTVKFKYL
eukprot:TRINITY_DN10291_c0_g1_i1.p1 TRINITY_DN10291_c0_g1~~TRINITY_DN10291_c0_g1_i1.p1  ORF type:complete len:129 (-),score=16.96 TRINITY_DN10291_c0_g1_i1:752-1138(-)